MTKIIKFTTFFMFMPFTNLLIRKSLKQFCFEFDRFLLLNVCVFETSENRK